MKIRLKAVALSTVLAAFSAMTGNAVAQPGQSNPATEKLEQDLKSAVMNGSITIPQLKELKGNLDTLKEVKGAQKPGMPIDLMTPHTAVAKIKSIMATVKQPDQDTLKQDFQVVMLNKKPDEQSAEPETPGKKLGKDIFGSVMRGDPTDAQVEQLQQSLNSLEQIKTSGEGKFAQFRALKSAKSQIEQTMNAGSFRPQDRQAVLDDLNNLGPQAKGGRS